MVLRSHTNRIAKIKDQLAAFVANGNAHIQSAEALTPFAVDESIPVADTVHQIQSDLNTKRKAVVALRSTTESLQTLGAEWETIRRACEGDESIHTDYAAFIEQHDLVDVRNRLNQAICDVESIIRTDEQTAKEKEEDRVEERTSRPTSANQSRLQSPAPKPNPQEHTHMLNTHTHLLPNISGLPVITYSTASPYSTAAGGVASTLANMSSIYAAYSQPPTTTMAPSLVSLGFPTYSSVVHPAPSSAFRPPVSAAAPPSLPPTVSAAVRADYGLPRLESLKFGGDFEEYASWRAWFDEAVDRLPLPDIKKAQHLTALVVDDAARVITNIPLAEYSNMLAALKDAFDRPDKVLELTIKRFESIAPIKYNHEVSELLLQLKAIDRSLRTHGATLDSALLLHRMESLLTPQLQLEVRRYRQASTGGWGLHAFFGILQSLQHLFAPRHAVGTTTPARPHRTLAVMNNDRKRWPCLFCTEHTHRTTDCSVYSTLSNREKRLVELNRCTRCLSSAHSTVGCSRTCAQCSGRHHRLLCPKLRSNQTLLLVEPEPTEEQELADLDCEIAQNESHHEEQADIRPADQHHTFISRADGRILPSCTATIRHPHEPDRHSNVLVLLDTCADATYVTTDVAAELRLVEIGHKVVENETFGGHKRTTRLPIVEFELPLHNGDVRTVEAYVVPNIVNKLNVLERTTDGRRVHLTRRRPKVLLGWSVCPAIFGLQVNEENGYHTIPTNIGTVITQFTSKSSELEPSTTLVVQSPDDLIGDYWDMEGIGLQPAVQTDDINEHLWEEFQKTTVQLPSGQYQVHWLWNERKNELPTNFELAFRRTTSTLNRLNQSKTKLAHFRNIIEQQLAEGIIEKVCEQPATNTIVHYLPYQLIHKDSKTTPVRVVYDGSARCGRSPSINDCVHVGPLNLVDVVGILLRSRTNSVLVSSDVSKAFHRLQLVEEDRDAVRFLIPFDWNRPFDRNNLQVVRFRSVPFGIACSPSLLDMCIRLHLAKDPLLLDRRSSIYVDNAICSYETEAEAVRDSRSLREHLMKAQLPLREFYSNSSLVLEQIGESAAGLEDTKLLGIRWSPCTDSICIGIPLQHDQIVTKRTIASRNHKPFDPMGLLAPLFVAAKIFIHRLWERGANWDEVVTESELNEWRKIEEHWCGEFEIPRMATIVNESTRELHVFCDSSRLAFGIAAYLVTSDGQTCKSVLVFAKCRIAPKALRHSDVRITIPKLELQALTIATRAAQFLNQQLNRIRSTTVWSDSTIALLQVDDPSGPKSIFVRNRALEISRSRSQFEFRHVETHENPADLVSRGCTADELKQSRLWWFGPEWLLASHRRPATLVLPLVEELETADGQLPPLVSLVHTEAEQLAVVGENWADSIELTLRRLIDHDDPSIPATREWAEALLIRLDQANHPPGTKKSERLRLQADEHGVLRAHSRLDYSGLTTDCCHPIWLPSSGHVAAQIAVDTHNRLLHAGFATVLTEMRQRFHVSPKVIKAAQLNCGDCRLFDAQPFTTPDWAPLPSDRATPGRPFAFTGIDHAGPLKCKEGEFFILIFVCGRTRAIHLEVCRSTSTEDFLLAFDKFEARRGTPSVVLSDNSQTFNTAASLLTARLSTRVSFEWRQITPRAPWRGGMYEALIKPVKSALKRSVGRSVWPFVRLEALIIKIECVVNSRPLLRQSTGVVLRPLDFLRPDGQPNAPLDFDELEQLVDETYESEAPRRLHQQLIRQNREQMDKLQRFWTTWSSLYLTSLLDNDQCPSNSRTTRRAPLINEEVLISDDFSKRIHWPVGRIQSLVTSRDGVVRTATVLTNDGKVVTRAINQLFPLEVRAEHEQPSSPPPAAPTDLSEETIDIPSEQKESPPTNARDSQPEAHGEAQETVNSSGRPTRKAKERGRARLQSMLPFLSIVFAFILLLPVGSAAKICYPGAPVTYWTLPQLPHCSSKLLTEHAQPLAQTIELYERNFAESSTVAHFCTFHHREVKGGTELNGMTDIRTHDREPLPISATDCWRMVNTKRCAFGRLTQTESSWHSRSNVNLDIPNRFMSLFGYSSSIQKDCSFVETRVLTHQSAKTIRTNVASTPHCKYSSGACQIAPNSVIVWEPKEDAECSYVLTGSFAGQAIENHWISSEEQLYLDVTNETVADCGMHLNITRQGWAVRTIENPAARRKRDDLDNRSFTTKAEESGHSRFLQQQLLDSILQQVKATCAFIAHHNLLMMDMLLGNPQRTMERLVNQTAIRVQSIGNHVEIHWCKHLEFDRLQPLDSSICTERIPVRLDDSNRRWFWDPTTDELRGESGREVSCKENRVVQLGAHLFTYSFANASFSPLTTHNVDVTSSQSLPFEVNAEPIVMHTLSQMRALLFADQIADFQRLATAHNEWKFSIDSHELHAVHQPPFDWKEWALKHVAPWLLLAWRSWITLCGVLGCVQAFRIIRKATQPKNLSEHSHKCCSHPPAGLPQQTSTPNRSESTTKSTNDSWYA